MTIFKFPRAAQFIGIVAVIAGFVVAGCQRGPEATASAPMANAPSEYPIETSDVKNSTAAQGASLKVSVSLSPKVANKAAPEDVVFIFARAAQGSRMPLAIVRKHVKDLPITVDLGQSHSMNPQMTLSNVPEIIVVARVSKSGMATPRDGDLEGMSTLVKSGTKEVSVIIDKVLTGQKESKSPHV